MKLAEYRTEIEEFDPNLYQSREVAAAAIGSLAHEIESAAWNLPYREEAAYLAHQARTRQYDLLGMP